MTETKIPIQSSLAENLTLIPFEDYLHDVHFIMMKDTGLVMPQKYWNLNGFCQADGDQDSPTIMLPAELKAGVFTVLAFAHHFPPLAQHERNGRF